MPWAPDYVTLPLAKGYLRITHGDDDAFLIGLLTTASRAIDTHTGRQFGNVTPAQERKYTPWYNRRRGLWIVDTDDFQETTGLAITISGQPVTGTPEPLNAVLNGLAYTSIALDATTVCMDTVSVTLDKWGWTAFPIPVVDATKLQISRFYSRRNSPYGIAGSPDQGSELRLLAKVDPDVGVMVGRYYRPRSPK